MHHQLSTICCPLLFSGHNCDVPESWFQSKVGNKQTFHLSEQRNLSQESHVALPTKNCQKDFFKMRVTQGLSSSRSAKKNFTLKFVEKGG